MSFTPRRHLGVVLFSVCCTALHSVRPDEHAPPGKDPAAQDPHRPDHDDESDEWEDAIGSVESDPVPAASAPSGAKVSGAPPVLAAPASGAQKVLPAAADSEKFSLEDSSPAAEAQHPAPASGAAPPTATATDAGVGNNEAEAFALKNKIDEEDEEDKEDKKDKEDEEGGVLQEHKKLERMVAEVKHNLVAEENGPVGMLMIGKISAELPVEDMKGTHRVNAHGRVTGKMGMQTQTTPILGHNAGLDPHWHDQVFKFAIGPHKTVDIELRDGTELCGSKSYALDDLQRMAREEALKYAEAPEAEEAAGATVGDDEKEKQEEEKIVAKAEQVEKGKAGSPEELKAEEANLQALQTDMVAKKQTKAAAVENARRAQHPMWTFHADKLTDKYPMTRVSFWYYFDKTADSNECTRDPGIPLLERHHLANGSDAFACLSTMGPSVYLESLGRCVCRTNHCYLAGKCMFVGNCPKTLFKERIDGVWNEVGCHAKKSCPTMLTRSGDVDMVCNAHDDHTCSCPSGACLIGGKCQSGLQQMEDLDYQPSPEAHCEGGPGCGVWPATMDQWLCEKSSTSRGACNWFDPAQITHHEAEQDAEENQTLPKGSLPIEAAPSPNDDFVQDGFVGSEPETRDSAKVTAMEHGEDPSEVPGDSDTFFEHGEELSSEQQPPPARDEEPADTSEIVEPASAPPAKTAAKAEKKLPVAAADPDDESTFSLGNVHADKAKPPGPPKLG